jgi:hypothetical protein
LREAAIFAENSVFQIGESRAYAIEKVGDQDVSPRAFHRGDAEARRKRGFVPTTIARRSHDKLRAARFGGSNVGQESRGHSSITITQTICFWGVPQLPAGTRMTVMAGSLMVSDLEDQGYDFNL